VCPVQIQIEAVVPEHIQIRQLNTYSIVILYRSEDEDEEEEKEEEAEEQQQEQLEEQEQEEEQKN
jgi:hypothetical protein